MKRFRDYDKVIHLSHIDADGYCCQWLVRKACVEEGTIYTPFNANYGNEVSARLEAMEECVMELSSKGKKSLVLITDLNLLPSDFEKVIGLKDKADVAIIDHHQCQPGVGLMDSDIDFILNFRKSASLLTYEWLKAKHPDLGFDGAINSVARCVNASDIFTDMQTTYFPIGRYISFLVSSESSVIPRSYNAKHTAYNLAVFDVFEYCLREYNVEDIEDVEAFLHQIDIKMTERLIRARVGEAEERRHTRQTVTIETLTEIVSELPVYKDKDGNRFIISTDIGPISDVANAVFNARDIDYIINFNNGGGVSVRVSPYSDRNASDIAKSINSDGGGHLKAAGTYYKFSNSEYVKGITLSDLDKVWAVGVEEKKPVFLIITGPSCSGKTHLEKELVFSGEFVPVEIITDRGSRNDDPAWVHRYEDNNVLTKDKELLGDITTNNGSKYSYYFTPGKNNVMTLIDGGHIDDITRKLPKAYDIKIINLKADEEDIRKCMSERGYDGTETDVRSKAYKPSGDTVTRDTALSTALGYIGK